jgi:hypothetical protein
MTTFQIRWIALGFFALILTVMATVTWAEAANIRICWDDASGAQATKIQAFADLTQLSANVLAGSTLNAPARCKTILFPDALPRGVDFAITLKSENTFGEVSPSSNAVTFRAPVILPAPTILTVQPMP